MKVLLIGALLTMDMPVPYMAERLPGKPSSVVAKGGSSQYNWNSPFVIQDTLYYLHYLSKRVSSIATSLKVLLTQPASIHSSSVPLTICNLFWSPTQWSWWITVVSISTQIYKISLNLSKCWFFKFHIFSILRMQIVVCAVNFYHHTLQITTRLNFSSLPWNTTSDIMAIMFTLLWMSYLRQRFIPPLLKQSATSLNKIHLDSIGIAVMSNLFYL